MTGVLDSYWDSQWDKLTSYSITSHQLFFPRDETDKERKILTAVFSNLNKQWYFLLNVNIKLRYREPLRKNLSYFFHGYQYALSDSLGIDSLVAVIDSEAIYSSTPLSPLNTPSGANTDGAFVVGKSPQQLSANFLMSYCTNSMLFSLKMSTALRESEPSSMMSTGLRLFISGLPWLRLDIGINIFNLWDDRNNLTFIFILTSHFCEPYWR